MYTAKLEDIKGNLEMKPASLPPTLLCLPPFLPLPSPCPPSLRTHDICNA